MTFILPGFERGSFEEYGWSDAQFVTYVVCFYMLIGLYMFLLVLAIVNIWTILIKQRRYKTLPLLAFYIFAVLSIAFRLTELIMISGNNNVITHFLNDLFLITKLSVGLIQSWMIFEIALRVRQTYKAY